MFLTASIKLILAPYPKTRVSENTHVHGHPIYTTLFTAVVDTLSNFCLYFELGHLIFNQQIFQKMLLLWGWIFIFCKEISNLFPGDFFGIPILIWPCVYVCTFCYGPAHLSRLGLWKVYYYFLLENSTGGDLVV